MENFQERAQKLEAMSRTYEDKLAQEILGSGVKRGNSLDRISHRKSVAILSWAASHNSALPPKAVSAECIVRAGWAKFKRAYQQGSDMFPRRALWANTLAPIKLSEATENCDPFVLSQPQSAIAMPCNSARNLLQGRKWKFIEMRSWNYAVDQI